MRTWTPASVLRSAAACCTVLAGCAPGFAGRFEGELSSAGSCTASPIVEAVTVELLPDGAGVRWIAPCGATVHAVVQGVSARMEPFACPSRTSGRITTQASVTYGTMTLSGDAIAIAIEFVSVVVTSGESSSRCELASSGTLRRRGP